MRAAILGAFPFPYPQGSQVFVTDHSRALTRAGFEVSLFTYGRGIGTPPADLERVASPRWLSPSSMRSGPSLAKLPADAGLLIGVLAAHRERPFDVSFAHNAEAAAVALAARAITHTPVIYVAHTIMRYELASYASGRWDRVLCKIGTRIDRFVAERVDGIIALCEDARSHLAPHAAGPFEIIPPGLDPQASPSASNVAEACARHALRPGRYTLYCGNLDGYQDLHLLADAAREVAKAGDRQRLEIVVATHDASRIPREIRGIDNLACTEVDAFDEMRCLIAGAQSVVLTRRRPGGFPIKLLNYMEAAKPIVAYEGVAPGFEHLRNAWLLSANAGGKELASALRALAQREDLRADLGRGARQLLEDAHPWARLAQKTRVFAEAIVAERSASRTHLPIN
jgi:glycosyltransferase involved in cell wall biosynthesis